MPLKPYGIFGLSSGYILFAAWLPESNPEGLQQKEFLFHASHRHTGQDVVLQELAASRSMLHSGVVRDLFVPILRFTPRKMLVARTRGKTTGGSWSITLLTKSWQKGTD
jgi:hypothetical protein